LECVNLTTTGTSFRPTIRHCGFLVFVNVVGMDASPAWTHARTGVTISMEILNDPRMADGEDGELKEKLSGRRRT
jgi:hypothetical protein